jgi:hypothetical protein
VNAFLPPGIGHASAIQLDAQHVQHIQQRVERVAEGVVVAQHRGQFNSQPLFAQRQTVSTERGKLRSERATQHLSHVSEEVVAVLAQTIPVVQSMHEREAQHGRIAHHALTHMHHKVEQRINALVLALLCCHSCQAFQLLAHRKQGRRVALDAHANVRLRGHEAKRLLNLGLKLVHFLRLER